MSKKTQKAAPARRTTSARPASGSRRAAARPAPAKSRPRAASRTPRADLRTLRIAAAALAVLSLAGLITLLAVLRSPYSAGPIIAMLLLTLVAAASFFTAVRPRTVASWFNRLGK